MAVTSRRRVWKAETVRVMARRRLELVLGGTESGDPRCAWCGRDLPQGPGYCDRECAEAMQVAGLYLG